MKGGELRKKEKGKRKKSKRELGLRKRQRRSLKRIRLINSRLRVNG